MNCLSAPCQASLLSRVRRSRFPRPPSLVIRPASGQDRADRDCDDRLRTAAQALGDYHERALDTDELAGQADPAGAGLSGPAALKAVEAQLAGFPPLVFAGEARKLKKALGQGRRGRGLPAAGRRLRRELRRAFGRQHPRFLPRVPADGGGADLRRRVAGGEGRPHRRPVRQAALRADRDDRRRRAADLSRRHHQRHRVHARGAHARSAPPDRGLPPVGGDAEPAARLRDRRLRQPRERRIAGCSASSRTARSPSRYQELADRITETLDFMRAIGLDPEAHPELRTTDFYTSHEALLLGYEQAMTRVDSTSGDWYATSGHMIWIGDRTRQLDHAHVEYCRGIKNPIGLKCGPSLKPDELLRLIDILNPDERAGRLTLIAASARTRSASTCRRWCARSSARAATVVWSCDPMHGNTIKAGGAATRPGRSTGSCQEVRDFFAVHQAEGTHAGGVHLEMTGKNVTECTGGARAISDADLHDRYHTHLRSAAQRRAGARTGVPGGRAAQEGAPRARPPGVEAARIIARESRGSQGAVGAALCNIVAPCGPSVFRPMPASTIVVRGLAGPSTLVEGDEAAYRPQRHVVQDRCSRGRRRARRRAGRCSMPTSGAGLDGDRSL